MFKRFLVMDLYNSDNMDLPIKDWISVEKGLPDVRDTILKVRLENNEEVWAYFCKDKIAKLCYGPKAHVTPSYFWDKTTKQPIDHKVTHWGQFAKEHACETAQTT